MQEAGKWKIFYWEKTSERTVPLQNHPARLYLKGKIHN